MERSPNINYKWVWSIDYQLPYINVMLFIYVLTIIIDMYSNYTNGTQGINTKLISVSLQAFSEPLEYDRLVGTFQEVVSVPVPAEAATPVPPSSALSRSPFGSRSGKRYGVSDEERESMLEWCKNNRLPYFLELVFFFY